MGAGYEARGNMRSKYKSTPRFRSHPRHERIKDVHFWSCGFYDLGGRGVEKVTGEKRLDYRLVGVGSLLPDLIDKPIGRVLFQSTFESGRVYAHTLAFVLLLTGIGLYRLYRYDKLGWLVLAGASMLHEVFDRMWMLPRIWFWPFISTQLSQQTNGAVPAAKMAWVYSEFQGLMTDPYIYISEIIGLGITTYFAVRLYKRRGFSTPLRTGKMG
ncbi:LexA-binding, inner membrane-associated putative hydrolase [Acididesulfobacillus acetoxydans]|uniref:LexA-binding, inner membrane-associated putative hydrolase n=1 Tax=Acididesulfobacillus acetoxydans TaxID=1561005 RepID=A0A8S0WA51_9FIRM|nr:metal-dependent hydrolase [Acididesulfobacillus acetoxydans]CAA7603139.1 LexA-binding, inner membrane-associated putative hydrolase [Acididesulfobacillus acetoxydans]CEJ07633.1 Predicted membrane-bound metal-dependent hydrolase (DUF457) [Acididesulfobacillus acetoxydans]